MRGVLTFIGLLLAVPGAVFGGGQLVVATDGVPVGWDTANPVPYSADQGGLGVLSNAEAVALVEASFGPWQDVPTATVAFTGVGATPVDVNASNFGPFLGPFGGATSPLGMNVIVFDADGSIFDTLFGIGSGVVGFADPTFFSDGVTTVRIGDAVPPGAKIVEGLAFLNGKFIDGIDNPAGGNFELPLDVFTTVFVHEFGHFAGLDHTQIHGLRGAPDSDSPYPTQPVETMFPFLTDAGQGTLERDDVVALSVLYPTPAFFASTGRITGRVLTSDGTPLSGVNVIARNVADDSDAISFVSGATIVPVGAFFLNGLTPGASYRVEIQQIDAFHTGGSRVGPFSPPVVMPGPPEFHNGASENADPALDDPTEFTPIGASAGVEVGGIDIMLNRQLFSVDNALLSDANIVNFAVGDFDGDGIADFVGLQLGFVPGNLIRLYRGLGGGQFAAPVTIDAFPGNEFVVAGQFNSGVDSFLDIVVASSSLNDVRVYFGNGTGGFGPPTTVVNAPGCCPEGVAASLVGLAVGDLNDDPFPDLCTLVLDFDTGGATVYGLVGSASGSFSVRATSLSPGSGFPVSSLAIGRLAGSPAGDVIGFASESPPALGLLVGDGAAGFSPTQIPLSSISNRIGSGLALGDFDANGTLDVALNDLHPVGGSVNFTRSFIDILLGNGNGAFTLSSRYEVAEVFQFGVVAADLDGDGHLDIASTGTFIAPGSPGAKVNVAFGDGAGGVRDFSTIWGLTEFPAGIAAADFDGDGRTDLLVNLSVVGTYAVLLNQIPVSGSVNIDIKPGSFPNTVNPRSRGLIPLAILTTATFDATKVDPLSVKFGPGQATEAHRRGHVQDVNGDGRLDLVLHFDVQDSGLRCGDTSASLTGKTFSGQSIQGSDSIRTVGCR